METLGLILLAAAGVLALAYPHLVTWYKVYKLMRHFKQAEKGFAIVEKQASELGKIRKE